MSRFYIFDKFSELKDKFSELFQFRKKIKALENYAEVGCFKHRNYLTLIKQCMNEGFPGDEEVHFLDHMLKKYELNYLDWAHRTKWLKNQMANMAAKNRRADTQMYIDFNKQAPTPDVPFEVMLEKRSPVTRRV